MILKAKNLLNEINSLIVLEYFLGLLLLLFFLLVFFFYYFFLGLFLLFLADKDEGIVTRDGREGRGDHEDNKGITDGTGQGG